MAYLQGQTLSSGDSLLLKARDFVDYLASCGNDQADELVHQIDDFLHHRCAFPATRAAELAEYLARCEQREAAVLIHALERELAELRQRRVLA